MLDIKPTVVTALNTINIPVCYELGFDVYDSKVSIPCISYIEYMNSDDLTGDTLGYSNIGFTVTVWAQNPTSLETYSKLVDTKMRDLGFKRSSSNELKQGNLIRKVLDYKCLAKETY